LEATSGSRSTPAWWSSSAMIVAMTSPAHGAMRRPTNTTAVVRVAGKPSVDSLVGLRVLSFVL
jgi:hypothetical protein